MTKSTSLVIGADRCVVRRFQIVGARAPPVALHIRPTKTPTTYETTAALLPPVGYYTYRYVFHPSAHRPRPTPPGACQSSWPSSVCSFWAVARSPVSLSGSSPIWIMAAPHLQDSGLLVSLGHVEVVLGGCARRIARGVRRHSLSPSNSALAPCRSRLPQGRRAESLACSGWLQW